MCTILKGPSKRKYMYKMVEMHGGHPRSLIGQCRWKRGVLRKARTTRSLFGNLSCVKFEQQFAAGSGVFHGCLSLKDIRQLRAGRMHYRIIRVAVSGIVWSGVICGYRSDVDHKMKQLVATHVKWDGKFLQ